MYATIFSLTFTLTMTNEHSSFLKRIRFESICSGATTTARTSDYAMRSCSLCLLWSYHRCQGHAASSFPIFPHGIRRSDVRNSLKFLISDRLASENIFHHHIDPLSPQRLTVIKLDPRQYRSRLHEELSPCQLFRARLVQTWPV